MIALTYSTTAVKQIANLPPNDKRKILRKLERLGSNPLIGKKLQGELKDIRSLRAWPYRILYQLLQNEIYIISVAHRQGAYN